MKIQHGNYKKIQQEITRRYSRGDTFKKTMKIYTIGKLQDTTWEVCGGTTQTACEDTAGTTHKKYMKIHGLQSGNYKQIQVEQGRYMD